MNHDKMLQLAKHIEKNFKHFDMYQWYCNTPCGTQACIAGHAMILFNPSFNKYVTSDIFVKNTAIEELELSNRDAENLFYKVSWNAWHRLAYAKAENTKRRAEVAAMYIRYMVKQDKLRLKRDKV